MSRRAQITMSAPGRAGRFLAEQRVLMRHQRPRRLAARDAALVRVRDGGRAASTYGRSQKVRNLERDPRCTLQVEAGDVYDDLRGVMLRAEVVLDRDPPSSSRSSVASSCATTSAEPHEGRGRAGPPAGVKARRPAPPTAKRPAGTTASSAPARTSRACAGTPRRPRGRTAHRRGPRAAGATRTSAGPSRPR